MERFNTYLSLSETLATHQSDAIFLEFIQGNAPLSSKLREKWLYQLAKNNDWEHFNQYYQPSHDKSLMCYEQIAKYSLGMRNEALKASRPLWLTGDSSVASCNHLFDLLLKDANFDQNLITERIHLALEQHNIGLAQSLLKNYKNPHDTELKTLNSIQHDPINITRLSPGELYGDFYLYGLKRLAARNMKQALKLWQQPHAQKMLNTTQQQAFLAHVALYKALRNHKDTLDWFEKVQPQYYNDILLEWRIRFALKQKKWIETSTLIKKLKNKDDFCWRYWLARSYEAQGKQTEANALYESLAKNRNYYGFLASLRIHTIPSFTNELPITNLEVLKPYQAFIERIHALYETKQNLNASRLLHDFISELPKEEASALIYWVDTTLQWYGQSVYLSSSELLNNQLTLRFPLAYKDSISLYSRKYTIAPELIYAIIRQESTFRNDAISTAGARGLMQVMPYTAHSISQAHKIPYNNLNQLFLSEKNIHIGVAYLKQLANRFSNHPILIAAAYNAGPKQVVYWLKKHPPKEIDIWIETLPWQETRNYLKNVMAFYAVYQYRLGQKPNLDHFLEPLT